MKRSIKTVLIVLLILAVLALTGFIGYKVFKVKNVAVEGNVDIKTDDIVSLSGIKIGTNIFLVDLEKIKEKIDTSPFLQCESVTRKYPNTLVIKVKERIRRAVIQYADKYLIIDEYGVILETGDETAKESLPSITGINITSFQIGSQIKATDNYRVSVLKDVLVELQLQNISGITEVDVANPVGITLLCSSGMKVFLGDDSNVKGKLERMTVILKELEKQGKQTGALDVSIESGGTYSPQ